MCIWSAGCSSGEEPYTLSMIIQDFLGNQASLWDTRLLATDISQEVLSKAKAAQYPSEALKVVSENWKKKILCKAVRTRQLYRSPSGSFRCNIPYVQLNVTHPFPQ